MRETKPIHATTSPTIDGDGPDAVALDYRGLVERLRQRFDLTDRGISLGEILRDVAPTYEARLDRLRRAHEALIGHAAAAAEVAGATERELATQLDGVMRAIDAHEEAESDLLQEALLLDLGGSE